jgi:methionyl-tRNA synthetase
LPNFSKRAGTIIGVAANFVANLSVLLHPYMPETSAEIQRQCGLQDENVNVFAESIGCLLPAGHLIGEVHRTLSQI